MNKLLVSWIAYNNDIIRSANGAFEAVSDTGPHYEFYKNFYSARGYTKHILLYADEKQELLAEHLKTSLMREFPGTLMEPTLLPLSDVIDLEEVKTKVEAFLLKLKQYEIDIFFSPGTSSMQVAWYLCHQGLGLKTHLIQTRAGKFTRDGKPQLTETTLQQSTTPVSYIIKQQGVDQENTGQRDLAADQKIKITPSIAGVYDLAYKLAKTDQVRVLIRGESGTGKEYLARFIHDNSIRKGKPFSAVNCAALADNLLESRLFGHRKGAFTGSDRDEPGILKKARGGTVFLDEIGDISPYMQQALLRVLQEGEIQPIGGETEKVDIRFLAATNASLEQKCREGKFRWDLYYRLAVAELELPALHERGTPEIKALLDFFIGRVKKDFERHDTLKFSREALNAVLNYAFPGNIRELENMVQSLYACCDGEVTVQDLPKRMRHTSRESPLLLDDVERYHIERVLKLKKGNQKKTAEALGIVINTLKSKLRKYGILQEELSEV